MYEKEIIETDLLDNTPAGFWIRVLANIIDSFVLSVPIGLIHLLIGFNALATDNYIYSSGYFVGLLVSYALTIGYYGLLTSSKHPATIGKMVVGIKVIGANGRRITLPRAIGRSLATYLSGIFYIGYIMVGLTNRKRGLHDFIANTYVVYKDK